MAGESYYRSDKQTCVVPRRDVEMLRSCLGTCQRSIVDMWEPYFWPGATTFLAGRDHISGRTLGND